MTPTGSFGDIFEAVFGFCNISSSIFSYIKMEATNINKETWSM